MATHDYVIDNSTGANVRADINSVLQAILTNNSSSSAPSTTAAYMFWADTTSGTLKIRNSSDNAWVELLQLDGTLTLEDGSASTPGLAFRDDLNTGIFSSAANHFCIATNGNEVFTIDEIGRVGIGFTNPNVELNVNGATPQIRLEETATGNSKRLDLEVDASLAKIGANQSAQSMAFSTANNEAMRIDSSGRLLIGTSSILHSQSNKLNVAGTDASTAISLNRYSDNALASYIYFRKSRSGTIGGNTSVQDDDLLGRIYFEGNDGSSPVSAAFIEAHVDGTPGNQDMPGRLEFLTAADGTPTPVERMRIDSSGNVGIGTTSPSSYNNLADDLVVATSSDTGITIATGTSSQGSLFFADGTSGSAMVEGFVAYEHSNNGLKFGTSNAERMRIDSSGRLLIGSSSHVDNGGIEAHLQVLGTGTDDTSIILSRYSNDGSSPFLVFSKSRNGSIGGNTVLQDGDRIGRIKFFGNDGTDGSTPAAEIDVEVDGTPGSNDMPGRIVFKTTADGASSTTERMRIDSSGRVLIGSGAIATPKVTSHGLDIAANNMSIVFGADSNSGVDTSTRTNNAMKDQRIGAVHYKNAEEPVGVVRVLNQNVANDISFGGGSSIFNAATSLRFFTGATNTTSSGSERMRIDSSGNLLVGTTSTSNAATGTKVESSGQMLVNIRDVTGTNIFLNKLGVNGTFITFAKDSLTKGNITTDGTNTAYNTSSDYRLKENETLISDGITRLKTLKPYRFNWKSDKNKVQDGFFAHEVTAVPEAITGTKDEIATEDNDELDYKKGEPIYQSLDYSKLTPLLTAALQEAITKIEVLETKVAALEAA